MGPVLIMCGFVEDAVLAGGPRSLLREYYQ
jgi:hypothetical protein